MLNFRGVNLEWNFEMVSHYNSPLFGLVFLQWPLLYKNNCNTSHKHTTEVYPLKKMTGWRSLPAFLGWTCWKTFVFEVKLNVSFREGIPSHPKLSRMDNNKTRFSSTSRSMDVGLPGLGIFTYQIYLGASKNRGTPKSSILIGISNINHPFWSTPIFGNTHLNICAKL